MLRDSTIMIRKAVGAIVFRGEKYLLVGKVKLMEIPNGPVEIPLEWHIPRGGVIASDESNIDATERELREETDSKRFRIIRELENKLCFIFPLDIQEKTGFEKQETVMFLVEYIGTGDDLSPIDEEISRVEFVTKEVLFQRILVKETREYFRETLDHLSFLIGI